MTHLSVALSFKNTRCTYTYCTVLISRLTSVAPDKGLSDVSVGTLAHSPIVASAAIHT